MTGRPRKYPKISGYCVYVHVLPNKDIYVGMTKNIAVRWGSYKYTTLEPFIEKYGWENIEHLIIQDGLTKAQAEVVEDWFIVNATRDGFCVNKKRSGGYRRDNPTDYQREYQHKRREYFREYRKTEKWKEYYRQWVNKNKN